MSGKARKPKAGSPEKRDAGLRQDVQEAIDRAWPDGIVELSYDPDESYFWEVDEELRAAFHHIANAHLLYEREAQGEPIWWGSDAGDEEPPDEMTNSRSYHVFFLSPEGEAFTCEIETEVVTEPEFMAEEFEEGAWGEDPLADRNSGTRRTGWVVAVSLVAPFAVIEFGDRTSYDDGSGGGAEIEPYAKNEDGEWINLEEEFRKAKGDQAYEILLKLRAEIRDILEKHGVAVLPAGEWRRAAPRLRGGEETCMAIEDRPVRVLDAFFFEQM
jgi:hypothetical protein